VSDGETNGRGEILLVSPSRIFGRALSRMVEQLGFRVRLVREGAPPSPAGSVLCLVHKHPNAVRAADAPTVPIIAFSEDAAAEHKALEAGAWDFLQVPCRPRDLAHLIDQWLAIGATAPARPEPPAAAPAAEAADGAEVEADEAPEAGIRKARGKTPAPRILLVDDSQVIHSYVETALTREGYEIFHAYDGREGLKQAAQLVPDLVISDIDMPEMNGFEMCRAIKNTPALAEIPILILSARGTGVDIDLGFDVGANDFLTKPVSENELVSRVDLVLGGAAQSTSRELVLVVEDSAVQRRLIAQALSQQGFEVHQAEDGQQGLEMALELSPDLIVTDSEMPRMNGRDLTREVKKRPRLRDVPVMMLTAADSELARAKGRHAGVSAYLAKPFVADKVVVIAEKLMGERRLLREREAMQRYLSSSAAAAASAAADVKGALDESMRAEMRFATVLFSDIVGFTPLTERLPPAQLITLLNDYCDEVVPLVSRYGGVVDKLIGDAVMALYIGEQGAQGHRVAACGAVRTALEMLAALARFNEARDEPLGIRIGVHSGPMVMGDIGSRSGRRDYTALGDNVNIGARLESAAAPNSVLISQATYDLVRHEFEADAVGPIQVKGKSELITVYRPTREKVRSPGSESVTS
jgi:DNA-binding response OmpR family regulator